MEILMNMLTILAWVAVVSFSVIIVFLVRIQKKYDVSLEAKIDELGGQRMDYLAHTPKMFVIFIIALVYLVAKYFM